MSELIADLPYRLTASNGAAYYVSVAGEQRTDGHWEAWLEYVPDDESDALLTDTETTQSSRSDVERWAEALTEIYVQGAFDRAVTATDASPSRLVARVTPIDAVVAELDVVRGELPDPFELLATGTDAMRFALRALPRSTLLDIIDTYDLNPAQKGLGWLSQAQLVTFIVTAADIQVASGKRTT